MNTGHSRGGAGRACRARRALIRWIDEGGCGQPPMRLAAHLERCPRCLAWASRIARLQTAMALLLGDPPPLDLVGQANEKALRMLARRLRAGEQAVALRTARPRIRLRQWIGRPLSCTAPAAAAAVVILTLRASVADSVQRARDLAEPQAQCHLHRHIDDSGLLL